MEVGEGAGGLHAVQAELRVETEPRDPFPFVAQLHAPHVLERHRGDGTHHEIVAVQQGETLSGGFHVVAVLQREVVPEGLEGVIVLRGEGMDVGHVIFEPLVAESVGDVGVQEILRVEVGRGHAADAQAESFRRIVVDGAGQRAVVPAAGAAVAGGGHELGGERLDGVDGVAQARLPPDLHLQAVQHALLGAQGDGTHAGPVFVRAPPVRVVHQAVRVVLQGVRHRGSLRGELVFVVHELPVGVQLLHPLEDVEAGEGVFLRGGPNPGRHLLEVLLDGELADVVEVDPRRDAQAVALDGVGAVRHHVQVPREAEAAVVRGHEGQVDAAGAVHHQGVRDVVFVEGRREGGVDRAHEAVQHHLHVLVEDVGIREDGLDVGADAALVQHLGEAQQAPAHHEGARFGRLAVPVGLLFLLAQRDRQHRGVLELGGVHVFLEEREAAPEAAAVEVHVEVVQRQDQLVIVGGLVVLQGPDVVLVLVGDDVPDEFHGGVVAAPVAAVPSFLGRDHGALQAVGVRFHFDLQAVGRPARLHRDVLRLIAEHLETHGGVVAVVLQGEGALGVGHRADARPQEDHGHVGHGFARLGVGDGSPDAGRRLGGQQTRPQQDREQKQDNFPHILQR